MPPAAQENTARQAPQAPREPPEQHEPQEHAAQQEQQEPQEQQAQHVAADEAERPWILQGRTPRPQARADRRAPAPEQGVPRAPSPAHGSPRAARAAGPSRVVLFRVPATLPMATVEAAILDVLPTCEIRGSGRVTCQNQSLRIDVDLANHDQAAELVAAWRARASPQYPWGLHLKRVPERRARSPPQAERGPERDDPDRRLIELRKEAARLDAEMRLLEIERDAAHSRARWRPGRGRRP